jgi:hypothetical protein
VLNELVVRRTRTDIRKYYQEDNDLLKFPAVKGPNKLEYTMDSELQRLFYDTVTAICPRSHHEIFDPDKHIGFYRYAAICNFTNPQNKAIYERRNLTVEGITSRLQQLMQKMLVKRLESSIAAFKSSLSNLLSYTDFMIDMLAQSHVYICQDINVYKLYQDTGNFDKFQSAMDQEIAKKGGNNYCFTRNDFHQDYIKDLKNDHRLIQSLLERWNRNTLDPKFERFKEALLPELFNPAINNPSGFDSPRLVIFTEAIDTQKSLVRYIRSKGKRVLEVSGDNLNANLLTTVFANFDANLAPENQKNDYDVLVTTEVLAEGVNLHRANVILNYDAPWNATRLMQRIGRVNRIGSKEEFVHVFNFFPSDEGNREIRFIEKAYAKLQSFHEMFGEDNKVFSEREELCEHDLRAMTDGEESPFGIYIKELRHYQQTHTERYAFIKALPALHLGGRLTAVKNQSSLFVFTDDTKGYVSVCVPAEEAEEGTRILSTLETIQYLQCDETLRFDGYGIIAEDERQKLAQNYYSRHVSHYLLRDDSSKKMNKALDILKDIRDIQSLTTESKRLLKRVDDAVRNKDSFTINLVLKFGDPRQLNLFGIESDINAILAASFKNVVDKAKKKRGESQIAMFEHR